MVPLYVLDDDTPGRGRSAARSAGGCITAWPRWPTISPPRARRWCCGAGRRSKRLRSWRAEVGARRVHALRHYEPWWQEAEQGLAERLDLELHDGLMLASPRADPHPAGRALPDFHAFWRALSEQMPPAPPPARAAPHGARQGGGERCAWRLGPAADQARLGDGIRRMDPGGRGRDRARGSAGRADRGL